MIIEILASFTHSPFLLILSGLGYGFMMIKLYKWAYKSNVTVYNHGVK